VGDTPFLDCTGEEEDISVGTMLVSHMPSMNEVTSIMQTGEIEGNEVTSIIDLAADACSQMIDAIRLFWSEEATKTGQ
jgi:ribonuclease PH